MNPRSDQNTVNAALGQLSCTSISEIHDAAVKATEDSLIPLGLEPGAVFLAHTSNRALQTERLKSRNDPSHGLS
jgi:hypothetical protein